jgi:hypothetical protein
LAHLPVRTGRPQFKSWEDEERLQSRGKSIERIWRQHVADRPKNVSVGAV